MEAEKNLVTFNSIKNEILSKARLSIAKHIKEANFIEKQEVETANKKDIFNKRDDEGSYVTESSHCSSEELTIE